MRKLFSYEIYGNIITRLPRWIVNINPAITYLSSFNTYSSSSLSSRLFSCTGNRVVHAKPEEFKNAALFLQFGLPLIGYKHGAFRKAFFKPEVENVGLCFSVRFNKNYDVTIIMWFACGSLPQPQISKMTGDCFVYKFFRCNVDETSVFKFVRGT